MTEGIHFFSFCDFYICPKYYLFRIFLVLFSEGFFLYWFLSNAKGYYHIQVLSNTYINSRILILYYHQASQLVGSQMEVIQVDQYESDTLDGDIIEKNDSTKEVMKVRRKTRTKFWFKDTTFDTVDEPEALVKNGWSKHFTNYTDKGRRIYYRCKKARRLGTRCNASVSLFYHADSDKVKVYKIEADHDHTEGEIRRIDEDIKKKYRRIIQRWHNNRFE